MADTQRISWSPELFPEDHPAVTALDDKIENLKAEYEVLGDTLAEHEEQLEKAEAEYKLARNYVEVARANLYSNERQRAALRDAIEYLTGKRP